MTTLPETIEWIPAAVERPPQCETVLLFMPAGLPRKCIPGYLAGTWCNIYGKVLEDHVTHWARIPSGPPMPQAVEQVLTAARRRRQAAKGGM